ARVVGVSGAVGKTSTKDLLAAVFAQRWRTGASQRSFNNELGVPLTLINAPDGCEALVVELGSRGHGEIAALCAVARPAVGVVTGGAHQVGNALAAAAAGLALGLTADDVSAGLGTAALSPWRMEVRRTPSGAVVINDAYNANPASTEAALRALARVPARRRLAVLGPMLELGAVSDTEHHRIGELARCLGIDRLVSVGAPAYGVDDVADVETARRAI